MIFHETKSQEIYKVDADERTENTDQDSCEDGAWLAAAHVVMW